MLAQRQPFGLSSISVTPSNCIPPGDRRLEAVLDHADEEEHVVDAVPAAQFDQAPDTGFQVTPGTPASMIGWLRASGMD